MHFLKDTGDGQVAIGTNTLSYNLSHVFSKRQNGQVAIGTNYKIPCHTYM